MSDAGLAVSTLFKFDSTWHYVNTEIRLTLDTGVAHTDCAKKQIPGYNSCKLCILLKFQQYGKSCSSLGTSFIVCLQKTHNTMPNKTHS